MKINYKKLILFIVVTFVVGGLFSFFIPDMKDYYMTLNRPPLSPSGIVFPIAWSILYFLMAISLYIVSETKSLDIEKSYLIYIAQLIVNSLWTLLFFGLKLRLFSFIWIILLIILVIIMIKNFYDKNKLAGLLQIPYLLWLIFAGYLNLMIYILNR